VSERAPTHTTLTSAGMTQGARDLLPAAPAVVVMAVAFGIAAGQAGLGVGLATLMSGVVFAGASQFVALGLWHAPLPVLAMWVAAFAVNSRFMLLGAAMSRWLSGLSVGRRALAVALLTEANWVQAVRAEQRGETDAGVLVGGGVLLWVIWLAGTIAGVLLGPSIPNPARFGLDLVLVLFFVGVLVDTWKGPGDLLPWAVAGAIASLPPSILPSQWSVLAGAVAGSLVGALRDGR
jgi:4-azaleucine resistance transporter AzlC